MHENEVDSSSFKEKKVGFNLSKTIMMVLIKLSLTALAFYVLRKKITFNPVTYLNSGNINYFLWATFFALGLLLLQAWRWKSVLKIFATSLAFKKCLVAVWFGHLINNLIPSGSGGDLLRSYTLRYANTQQGKWKWVGTFLSEKYCAATSALLIACVSLLSSVSTQLPWVLMGLIVFLFLGLLILPVLVTKIVFPIKQAKIQKIVSYLQKLTALLTVTFTNKNGRYAFLSSLLINVGMCVIFYIIASGLDVELSFAQCIFVVPVFTLLATLPISFAGWGIRELSCVGLLSFFGVSSESAVIVSVMYGLVILLSSLPGILVAYPFVLSMRYQRQMNAAVINNQQSWTDQVLRI